MKVQLTDCDTRDLVRGVKVDLEAKGDHWERRLLLLRRGLKVDTLTLRGWCYETRGGVVRKVRGRAEGGALGITGRVSRGQSDRQWQSRKTNTMNSDKVTGCSCLKCLFLSHLCPEIFLLLSCFSCVCVCVCVCLLTSERFHSVFIPILEETYGFWISRKKSF